MKFVVLLTVVLAALAQLAYADIPVRCLPTQFRKKWLMAAVPFPTSEKVTPDTLKEKCTERFILDNSDHALTMLVNVLQPNEVLVEKVAHPTGSDDSFPKISIKENDFFGMTMMSDQGFDMTNSKYSFFAFFSYILKKNGSIKSQCERTQVGWFSNAEKDVFGCFVAYKRDPEDGDVVVHRPISEMIRRENNLHISDDDEDAALAVEADDNDLFKPNTRLVDEINAGQNGWKATVYPQYKKMTFGEMRKRQGSPMRAHSTTDLPSLRKLSSRSQFSDDDDDAQHLAADGSETFHSLKRKEFRQLPKSFDWRDVKGVSYVSPVRDQGACGSCYAMATIDALEARIRIQTNNQYKLDLAVQDVMSCSPYSQQCNGGYPLGVARYASDFGIVTEDCMRYKAENGTCSSKCENPKIVARASSYYYVGGFLGAGNEEDMMFEIYKNGPIVAGFFVYDDFKYYKNGVYKHIEGKAGKKGVVNPIELTSHSVCIIGWHYDEKTGEKSWIVKNSWGKDFGEEAPKDSAFYKENCTDGEYCGGFFRIRRSVDESAIESAAVAFIPKLIINE